MRLRTVRLVSFTHRHLAAIEYELTAEDADTEIVISSELVHRQPFAVDSRDPRLAEGFARRVLHPTGSLGEGLRGILSYRTQSSGLTLGCGMDHVLSAESDLTADAKCNDDFAAVVFKGVVKRGKSIRIHKFLSYHYSDNAAPHEIKAQTGWTLDRAIEQSFDRILDSAKERRQCVLEPSRRADRGWDLAHAAGDPLEPVSIATGIRAV